MLLKPAPFTADRNVGATRLRVSRPPLFQRRPLRSPRPRAAPDRRSPLTPPAPPESDLKRSRDPGWPGERDPRGNPVWGHGASATTASGRRSPVRDPGSFRRTTRERESLTASAGRAYDNPDRQSNPPRRSLPPATLEQTTPS